DPIARIAAASAAVKPQTTGTAPAPAPQVPAPLAPAPDSAAASAAATSRLVAGLATAQEAARATTAATNSASPPQPQSTDAPSLPRAVPSTSTTAATAAREPAPPLAPPPAIAGGGRPLVIAIDAGHGGQDPGAIGPSGKREKDITLAIARELARQVNATPGLRARLVRDRDMFIPLTNRARIARQAKADMFISIHADAAENRNAKGSSVYVLSLRGASSQRARWLA